MSAVKITQADWDRVWLELAELRQSLNARPIAPTPDYRSDLPADEPCSCEESERLKAELGEAHVTINQFQVALPRAEREVARLTEALAAAKDRVRHECSVSEAAEAAEARVRELEASTRECREVAVRNATDAQHLRQSAISLSEQLAAANALLRRCTPWTDELRAAIQAHLSSQNAAPVKTPELRPGCTTAEYYETAAPTATSAQPLEFDDAVVRLKEVALSHGWRLSTWGLQRDHG